MTANFPTETVSLQAGKRIYFSSDFHLGAPDTATSRTREQTIVRWLEHIRPNAQVIFLVGDIFDFWFEYKYAVPKGFIRLLGKLAELADAGIGLVFFTGNHDMWMSNYFTHELGAVIHRAPVRYRIIDAKGNERTLLVGHGDGLGPGDHFYKGLKKVFENPLARWSFRQLHPDVGLRIAHTWSKQSRISNMKKGEEIFKGEEQEWLLLYCREVEQTSPHDYYIFGHRHLPLDLKVSATSRYINLGEWVNLQTYAVFDGKTVELLEWKGGKVPK
ncbi:UDP-2,3-diacylglucosamine diphosphatase [Persicitalea jodogahamensis]|uniref:UDP-2,3-diacylglucosamine hydrolase n=1 Tax=Persicitalea jodogahamensis TaxID=402147 RepID=A0A8J3G9Y3_9BACT|nr:UDP-2,3-diacylglucosamine diphosphatase [Persicitalea jodogahamensis]GHB76665.1 UDP-2,3-diacylglucosamine hydrolase [Persicitalea jodogahamensis]